jgi:hypothetical protein
VAILLSVAVVVGYLAAFARDQEPVRDGLRHIGLPYGPEATVIERTIFKMPVGAEVNVLFKDGRIASGIPTKGQPGGPRRHPGALPCLAALVV